MEYAMKEYPQETLGTTLLNDVVEGEYRRVYAVARKGFLEVGEFTKGPLTEALYNAQVHLHTIQIYHESAIKELKVFFAGGCPYLADYMDDLDARGIPYGYMNSMVGKYVSYRPAVFS